MPLRLPADAPEEVREKLVTVARRRDALTAAFPEAQEAVRLTELLAAILDSLQPPRTRDYEHGRNGFGSHGCRCETCRTAESEYRKRRLREHPEMHARIVERKRRDRQAAA